MFVCGFILGFLTQFYNIFSPFWFMIFAWTLPEIIIKIIPECEKDDPYYINESVKWSRGPRKVICKNHSEEVHQRHLFYRHVEKREKKSAHSCSLLLNTLSLEQETNMTETVTFIRHSPNHVSNFLHFK